MLSNSEKKMMQELEAMQTHIPVFLNQLTQIKEKEKLTSQVNITLLFLVQYFLKPLEGISITLH